MRVQSGSTDQVLHFVAVDATDLATRETGLSSFTVYRKRKGGAATAWTTPTITEASSANMPGVYGLLIDEDTTIDSGDDEQQVVLHITHAGMAPVTISYELFRPKITAGATVSSTALDKTNNLPSDPADASDIAAAFGTVNSTLATIAGYLDTEIAAIKAKTDNLPASPAATGDVPSAAANAAAVLAAAVEGAITVVQSLRLMNAALGGKASGLDTTTATFRDLADSKDRLVATVDDDGNRTAVTRDLT